MLNWVERCSRRLKSIDGTSTWSFSMSGESPAKYVPMIPPRLIP